MSEFSVKEVHENDLPKLADDMYMDPTYLKQVKEMMAKDLFVLFAVKHGETYVGRCTLWLAPADEPELNEEIPAVPQVNALEVHPSYRRQGIGTMLFDAVEHEARRRGHTLIAIGVEPDNDVARKLYEKLGYTYRKILGNDIHKYSWNETLEDGTIKKLFGESMLMVKEL